MMLFNKLFYKIFLSLSFVLTFQASLLAHKSDLDTVLKNFADSLICSSINMLEQIIDGAIKDGKFDRISTLIKSIKKHKNSDKYQQELLLLCKNSLCKPPFHYKNEEIVEIIKVCDQTLVMLNSHEKEFLKDSKLMNKCNFSQLKQKLINIRRQLQEIYMYLNSIQHLL